MIKGSNPRMIKFWTKFVRRDRMHVSRNLSVMFDSAVSQCELHADKYNILCRYRDQFKGNSYMKKFLDDAMSRVNATPLVYSVVNSLDNHTWNSREAMEAIVECYNRVKKELGYMDAIIDLCHYMEKNELSLSK